MIFTNLRVNVVKISADIRPAICHPVSSSVIFSHQAPPTEDFMLTGAGAFILKRPLNYNLAPKYEFVVTAKVSDTDRVLQLPAAV